VRRFRTRTLIAAALVVAIPAGAAFGRPSPERALEAALAEAGSDHRARMGILVELTWFTPDVDPDLRVLARERLVENAAYGMEPMLMALDRAERRQTAEIVDCVLRAHARVTFGVDPNLEPALVTALWVGSREAKRLAIPELALRRTRLSVIPMIDSAIDDPALLPDVVTALGQIGDDRARFFLEEVLNAADRAELRPSAAVAIASIGGKAMTVLHAALRSPDRDVRLTAARAMLPVASELDLTPLYEYIADHGNDDEALTASLKEACAQIERVIQARQAAEAASAPKDF